ncbi:hypothetical protein QBC47DRAFT_371516, partial [Echria macrotheca]
MCFMCLCLLFLSVLVFLPCIYPLLCGRICILFHLYSFGGGRILGSGRRLGFWCLRLYYIKVFDGKRHDATVCVCVSVCVCVCVC